MEFWSGNTTEVRQVVPKAALTILQGATTKETNASGAATGTNELDPLGRAVDSSGAYNYDGTNDYGVPAAGFYTPGSVPGVCGTTFGVSMSCGIVNGTGIQQRSIQELLATHEWGINQMYGDIAASIYMQFRLGNGDSASTRYALDTLNHAKASAAMQHGFFRYVNGKENGGEIFVRAATGGRTFTSISMAFDGCKLSVTTVEEDSEGNSTTTTRSLTAVSGKSGNRDENKFGGPIPKGSYSFKLSQIEYRYDKTFFGGWEYPSWAKNEKIGGDQSASGEADAYGDWRVRLTVEKNDVPNRSGYYLHGSQNGNGFGSLGCIDLGTNEACTSVLEGLRKLYSDGGWFASDLKVSVSVDNTCNFFVKKVSAGASGRPRN